LKHTKTCNLICTALASLLLVLNFLPFWSYDGMHTSIQGFVWFPNDHEPLTTWFAGQIPDYGINGVVGAPILILLCTVASVVVTIWKKDSSFAAVIPAACGIVGIWGYLTNPILQLGTTWVLHLIVSILLLAAALFTCFVPIKNLILKKRKDKE